MELAPLKSRPPIQKIVEAVAAHFGHDASTCRRSNHRHSLI